MQNTYVFEDFPVRLCQEDYNEEKRKLYESFLIKWPDLESRFDIVDDELLFTISNDSQISERNWTVDFLESNVNKERTYNGMGIKLSEDLYRDLYELFCDEDGDIIFESTSDHCIVETVGKFDSRFSFKLKKDGLYWTDEEDEDEDW